MQFILQADQLHHLVGAAAHIDLIFPTRRLHHEVEILEYVAIVQQLIILEYDTDLTAQMRDILAAQFTQVETRDATLARQERHLGIQRLQKR